MHFYSQTIQQYVVRTAFINDWFLALWDAYKLIQGLGGARANFKFIQCIVNNSIKRGQITLGYKIYIVSAECIELCDTWTPSSLLQTLDFLLQCHHHANHSSMTELSNTSSYVSRGENTCRCHNYSDHKIQLAIQQLCTCIVYTGTQETKAHANQPWA